MSAEPTPGAHAQRTQPQRTQPQHIEDVPHVSGVLLRVLADVLRARGIAPSQVLDGLDSRFATREPIDVRIPLPAYRAMLRRAIERTEDPALALHMGLSAHESAFDMMAPLVGHLPSLRHALREASRFGALVLEGAYLHASECAGTAQLRLELPRAHDVTDRILAEFVLACLMRLLHAFGCSADDLHAVHFEHPRPSHHHAYVDAFHGCARFAQPFTGLELSARALDRPHLHNSPALQSLVRSQAEQRLARLCREPSTLERLRTYLRNRPGGVPPMSVAARALGTSARSLRRRLTEQHSSYRELAQEIQREQACSMLRNRDLTLQHVASELGFSDITAFHRAFKRWTGQTASEYRLAQGGQGRTDAPSSVPSGVSFTTSEPTWPAQQADGHACGHASRQR